MSSVNLQVVQSSNNFAYTNRAYVNQATFIQIARIARSLEIPISASDPGVNLLIRSMVYYTSPAGGFGDGEIALNIKQRTSSSLTLKQSINAEVFVPNSEVALSSIIIHVDLLGKKSTTKTELKSEELTPLFKSIFNNQVFTEGQQLVFDFNGVKLDIQIDKMEHAVIVESFSSSSSSSPSTSSTQKRGQILPVTEIHWRKAPSSQHHLIILGSNGSAARNDSLFKKDFNFEQLGIGGLDEQFKKMFRTAFASRIFPGLVKQLGINHVRGMLLYGPPGCGKTLIARQIGKVLNAREPKIINGPEVLDKYVGGSEEKIRALFQDAEKEQAEAGDASMLHIIIFDEMDAIMKSRGSTRDSTGVSDSIVNQLLSKIDGVDSLNNILIIGMTNRKDMIDEAILRPGRLEIHIEITLPTEDGRKQILNIKTLDMRTNNRLDPEVLSRLDELAAVTKNYTGAELEGLVRNAASFALARNIDIASIKTMDESKVQVEWRDFERALEDTVPAFGNKCNDEIQSNFNNGIYNYGAHFVDVWETLERLKNQTKNSTRTPLMSVLVEGQSSTGKTAIASKLTAESEFDFIRMISPDSLIGQSESQKCATLLKTFSDSYKSPLSIIFIDDIERILEFTPVGMRFSNQILQTLLILIRKIPPPNCRLMVIATTSIAHLMEDLQLTQSFHVIVNVPQLSGPEEIRSVVAQHCPSVVSGEVLGVIAEALHKPIGIKQLLMVLEMAKANGDEEEGGGGGVGGGRGRSEGLNPNEFFRCLSTIGY